MKLTDPDEATVCFPGWFCHVPLLSEEQYQHAVSLPEQERLLQSQRHPGISIASTSCLNFGALMLPAPGEVGRFHSSHLPGGTRMHSKPTQPRCMAMCGSRAERSCRLHLGEELLEERPLGHHRHQIPTRFPASTAANPAGLREPPRPSSCTACLLLSQGLGILSQRKACLNSHTPKGGKVCLRVNWSSWTTSGVFPCYI